MVTLQTTLAKNSWMKNIRKLICKETTIWLDEDT